MADTRRPYVVLDDGGEYQGALIGALDEGRFVLVKDGVPLYEIDPSQLPHSGSELTLTLRRVDATAADAATWPEV